MKLADIPRRLNLPFGASAGASYIRTVPFASQIGTTDGAASYTDGFPPLTFTDEGAGGIPPDGRDVNGVLFDATGWARWAAAGGIVTFNTAFASAIGGYPKGAILASSTTGILWASTADDNSTNPDSGGAANWKQIAGFKATPLQVATGSDDATFITPAGLASVFGSASGESITLPGGRIEKIGRVRATLTGGSTYSVTFVDPFPNGILNLSLTPVNSTASSTRDNFPQIVSETASGFAYVIQTSNTGGDNTLNGIDWIAKGY